MYLRTLQSLVLFVVETKWWWGMGEEVTESSLFRLTHLIMEGKHTGKTVTLQTKTEEYSYRSLSTIPQS